MAEPKPAWLLELMEEFTVEAILDKTKRDGRVCYLTQYADSIITPGQVQHIRQHEPNWLIRETEPLGGLGLVRVTWQPFLEWASTLGRDVPQIDEYNRQLREDEANRKFWAKATEDYHKRRNKSQAAKLNEGEDGEGEEAQLVPADDGSNGQDPKHKA